MKTYRIALIDKSEGFALKRGDSKVSELIFWHLFNIKILKLILGREEQDEDVRRKSEDYILKQKGSLTILDMSFEIKGK